MPKRKRAVMSRHDTESASPGPSEAVGEENQADKSRSNEDASIIEQAAERVSGEKDSESSDESTNWGNQPLPPVPPGPLPVWDAAQSAGSQPLILGPPRTDYYRESETKVTDQGWSYEIWTYHERYRISTIPSDFIGNSSTWPSSLADAHEVYKVTEVPLDTARSDCLHAYQSQPIDHAEIYDLQKIRHDFALPAAKGRAAFMETWPSAFNDHGNTDGHVHWAGRLVSEARVAQGEGLVHFKRAWPDKDPNEVEWLNKVIATDDIVGLRSYAMSPAQYDTLVRQVQAKKSRLRGWVTGTDPRHWKDRINPNPTIDRPNLPLRKPSCRLPEYSPEEEERYSLPENLFNWLSSDECFV